MMLTGGGSVPCHDIAKEVAVGEGGKRTRTLLAVGREYGGGGEGEERESRGRTGDVDDDEGRIRRSAGIHRYM